MKTKHTVLLYILILSLGTILSLYIPKQEMAAQETMVIPDEAIRLRILANSDLDGDQNVKRLVRDEVNKEITNWVSNLTSQDEAKAVIKEGLPQLQKIAEDVVAAEGMDQSVKVEFGKVDFPTKLYGQYLYPAGEYEAVLITLGKGEGANWWCVLYPPLCFLDFSTGNAVRSTGFETKVEASGNEVTEVAPEDATQVSEDDSEDDMIAYKQVEVEAVEAGVIDEAVKEEVKAPANKEEEASVEKEEPVFVEDSEEEEVEVRFFVVDLFKGLFN
ncbi:stage II sporulation protein R [Rossellomorea vietnamensis]|uniref:stage II sporulation protein R n=1 Tax=Rossellomorea vietnamensis TaxID=218284 RepID=UPI0005510CFB|nr:stage II sporulation protein R [Rossellomorea vietnamensis]OXS56490.1 stage II sporulation protein R [Bacillus sp. DSM 27956]PRX72907.1 stage II sporulation protein R [Bacillus sp. V-88]SLK24258.1 stage II sporulation protein R [Bacillus sp. V-88]